MSEEANRAVTVLWVEWIPKVTKAGNSKDYLYSPRHLIGRQEKFLVFTLERAYSAAVYKNIEPKYRSLNDNVSSLFGHIMTSLSLSKVVWEGTVNY